MKAEPPKIIVDLMEVLKRSDELDPFGVDPVCAPTGSRVICTPPVLDTDNDWLVFVPDGLRQTAIDFLATSGATNVHGQEAYSDGVCFRHGDVNPILIWDYEAFYRWVTATYWAHRFNLTDKKDRIALFSAVVDRVVPLSDLVL